jgi:hypothetical protein
MVTDLSNNTGFSKEWDHAKLRSPTQLTTLQPIEFPQEVPIAQAMPLAVGIPTAIDARTAVGMVVTIWLAIQVRRAGK